jgi:hypothetical protein
MLSLKFSSLKDETRGTPVQAGYRGRTKGVEISFWAA